MHDRARFFEKKYFCPKNGGEMGQKWAKVGLLLENLVINFFQNLVCNESLRNLLYSCTNPIFGKNLVPEVWVKMLSASQITGYLNQLYL